MKLPQFICNICRLRISAYSEPGVDAIQIQGGSFSRAGYAWDRLQHTTAEKGEVHICNPCLDSLRLVLAPDQNSAQNEESTLSDDVATG
jgi:hypothetical protein